MSKCATLTVTEKGIAPPPKLPISPENMGMIVLIVLGALALMPPSKPKPEAKKKK